MSAYPALLVTGLFSLFGSATLAIPFLLYFVQLPADLFRLYIAVVRYLDVWIGLKTMD